MSVGLEDLRVLQVADETWEFVGAWDSFAKDTVGKQLTRSADSIGANIAEGFGRYHYGEKLRFLYYARGSLFETKYWLNRCQKRGLIAEEKAKEYQATLKGLSVQLNNFIRSIKNHKADNKSKQSQLKETEIEYEVEPIENQWFNNLNISPSDQREQISTTEGSISP